MNRRQRRVENSVQAKLLGVQERQIAALTRELEQAHTELAALRAILTAVGWLDWIDPRTGEIISGVALDIDELYKIAA